MSDERDMHELSVSEKTGKEHLTSEKTGVSHVVWRFYGDKNSGSVAIETRCRNLFRGSVETSKYFLDRQYTLSEKSAGEDGLCVACQNHHFTELPAMIECPGMTSEDKLYLASKRLAREIPSDDKVVVWVNQFNRLLNDLPEEVSNLIEARLDIERHFREDSRCPVCCCAEHNDWCAENC